MEPKDITIQILSEIRDAVRETNARLDQNRVEFGQKIEQLRSDVDERLDQQAKRTVEVEIRLSTAILNLGSTLEDVKAMLRENLKSDKRIDRCEEEIRVLKKHAGIA